MALRNRRSARARSGGIFRLRHRPEGRGLRGRSPRPVVEAQRFRSDAPPRSCGHSSCLTDEVGVLTEAANPGPGSGNGQAPEAEDGARAAARHPGGGPAGGARRLAAPSPTGSRARRSRSLGRGSIVVPTLGCPGARMSSPAAPHGQARLGCTRINRRGAGAHGVAPGVAGAAAGGG